jgi:hypothetical protein
MKLYETHSASVIESDLDVLLKRWARWLRAGSSGLANIGNGGANTDAAYSDQVAEMLDQLIAQLPKSLKHAIMDIWYRQKSETVAAAERKMSRARFKATLNNAIGWLCGSLASRINAPVSVDNVERWAKACNRSPESGINALPSNS